MTCRRRSGSPATTPARGSSTLCSRISLASAAGRTASSACSTTAVSSRGHTSSRILPLITRETSSRSSISCTWASDWRTMTSSARFICSSPTCPLWSMRAQPYTAFSGVRSSCETTARNWSLARAAASASAARCCTSAAAPTKACRTSSTSLTPAGPSACIVPPSPKCRAASARVAIGAVIRRPTRAASASASTAKATPPAPMASRERSSGASTDARGMPKAMPQPVFGDRA